MRVSTEKSKIMTNSTNNMGVDVSIDDQKLEEVPSSKHPGVTQYKDGSYSAEVCIRIVLLADPEKRNQSFETKCLRKPLRVSYSEQKTNDWVRNKISFLAGPQQPLLAAVKRWKLAWFGPAMHQDSLSTTMIQCTLKVGPRCGGQMKCWMDNVKGQTSMPLPDS